MKPRNGAFFIYNVKYLEVLRSDSKFVRNHSVLCLLLELIKANNISTLLKFTTNINKLIFQIRLSLLVSFQNTTFTLVTVNGYALKATSHHNTIPTNYRYSLTIIDFRRIIDNIFLDTIISSHSVHRFSNQLTTRCSRIPSVQACVYFFQQSMN